MIITVNWSGLPYSYWVNNLIAPHMYRGGFLPILYEEQLTLPPNIDCLTKLRDTEYTVEFQYRNNYKKTFNYFAEM